MLVTQLLGGAPPLGLALAVGVAAFLGARTTAPGAVGAAALLWACHDGFTVNGLGVLTARPADLGALAAVVGVALAARAARMVITAGPRLPAGYPAVTAVPGVRPA